MKLVAQSQSVSGLSEEQERSIREKNMSLRESNIAHYPPGYFPKEHDQALATPLKFPSEIIRDAVRLEKGGLAHRPFIDA
jgi:hypothetical protein